MKKITLIMVCAVLTYFSGSAQGVSEFAPVGAEWWIEMDLFIDEDSQLPVQLVSTINKYTSQEEIMHEGKLSKKISVREFHRYSNQADYSEVNSSILPIYVYSENDTAFYYHNHFEKYVPLYIFNAEVEDTLEFYVPESLIPSTTDSTFKVIVDSIFNYEVDGELLKTFVLRDPNEGPTSTPIIIGRPGALGIYSSGGLYIEKIGAPNGDFISHDMETYPVSGNVGGLLCFSDNVISISFNQKMEIIDSKCSITPGPSSLEGISNLADQIKIYPNPANEFLLIEGLENLNPIPELQVFDITGKQISVLSYSYSNKFEIDVRNLTSGIYFLKITAGQEFIYKKFSVL